MEILTDRIGRLPIKRGKPSSVGVSVISVAVGASKNWCCSSCASVLSEESASWRASVVLRETLLADAYEANSMYIRRRAQTPEVVLREYFCPVCAAVLTVDVGIAGDDEMVSPELA